jgi:geranylgeranyl reductase family protein
MRYDVIVAGAGPAGCTAGSELAQRGYSVLILEKETFPRNKLCAGGLPRKILRYVDIEESDVVEDRIRILEFYLRPDHRFALESTRPFIFTVRRDRFDSLLLRKARQRGCSVREGEPVRRLIQRNNGVTVQTNAGTYHGRILVGADGATGAVRRLAGFRPHRRLIATLQTNLPLNGALRRRFQGRIWIGFGWVAHGYAWIFPQRNDLVVGMGVVAPQRRARLLKRAFHKLLSQLSDGRQGVPVSSFPIHIYGRRQPLVRGKVLLAGEAGGLVQPLTAEGIYYAITSAHHSADAIDQYLSGQHSDLSLYQRCIDLEMGSFFSKSRLFSGLFYGLPRLSFRLFVNDNRYIRRYLGMEEDGDAGGLNNRCVFNDWRVS